MFIIALAVSENFLTNHLLNTKALQIDQVMLWAVPKPAFIERYMRYVYRQFIYNMYLPMYNISQCPAWRTPDLRQYLQVVIISPVAIACDVFSLSFVPHTHTHTHIVRVCVHYYQILSARLWPWLVWANQLMRRWRNSNKSRRRGVTNHAYDPNWT